MRALERQVEAHSAKLALICSKIARLEESVKVAQLQLKDSQLAYLVAQGECHEYSNRLGIQTQ